MLIRILLIFIVSITICNGQSREVRFANIDLHAAKQRAVIEDKLIFVDTYAAYCKPCKVLNREFKKPKLYQYLNKHFINVKVDMEGQFGQAFKNAYQVVFLPTLMILDKHGNLKFKIDRLATADELLALTKHYQEKLYPESKPYVAESNTVTRQPNPIVKAPVQKTTKPSTSTTTVRKPKPTETIIEAKVEPIQFPVADNNEVIVHVLGQDSPDLPPEVLKQEAYFRMELMDGSHFAAAQDYLETQEDWSTVENSRFLFDFLYTVNSPEFEYLINNKQTFEQNIGKQQVQESIDILVTKELEQAFPRPDKSKAKLLYSYTNNSNPTRAASLYNLSTLKNIGDTESYINEAKVYVKSYHNAEASVIKELARSILNTSDVKKELKQAKQYAEKATKQAPDDSSVTLLLSAVYYKLGNVRQAKYYANEAKSIAKANGQNVTEINQMIETLSAL